MDAELLKAQQKDLAKAPSTAGSNAGSRPMTGSVKSHQSAK